MVNAISYDQIYGTGTQYGQSSDVSSQTSFADVLSSNIHNSSGLGSGSFSSASTSELFLSLLNNGGGSEGMMKLFFAMLGLGSQSLFGSSSGSSLADAVSSVAMQKIQNGMSSLPSNYSEAIPSAASKAVNPFVTSTASNRSAAALNRVIDQFHVETNPRYEKNKKGYGDTYCNIFMWDVTRAMGAEIPHYVDPVTLEPKYYPDVKGARELTANGIYQWLEKKGAEYGWKEVSAETAQQLANQGRPVVTTKKNNSGSGHVQVVRPSANGTYNPATGVTVAQAGGKNVSYTTMSALYGTSNPPFRYYAHI